MTYMSGKEPERPGHFLEVLFTISSTFYDFDFETLNKPKTLRNA